MEKRISILIRQHIITSRKILFVALAGEQAGKSALISNQGDDDTLSLSFSVASTILGATIPQLS